MITHEQHVENNKQLIIDLYLGGFGTTYIAKKISSNAYFIYVALQKWNIPIRKRINYGKVGKHKREIINMFEEGASIKEIGRQFDIKPVSITKKLREWGYDTSRYSSQRDDKVVDHLDEIVELYNSGMTMQAIAKKYHTNGGVISAMFKRHGIKARSIVQYNLNENFFKTIDSDTKAYVLGFALADGNVSIKDNVGHTFRIQIADYDILCDIAQAMEYDGPIKDIQPPKKFPHRKMQYLLQVTRKNLVEDLIALGCVPAKSSTVRFPFMVDELWWPAICRGYFDGDGSVAMYKNRACGISITSSQPFLQDLLTFLPAKNPHIYIRYKNKPDSAATLQFNGADNCKSLSNYMYKNSTIHLERKYVLLQPHIDIENLPRK